MLPIGRKVTSFDEQYRARCALPFLVLFAYIPSVAELTSGRIRPPFGGFFSPESYGVVSSNPAQLPHNKTTSEPPSLDGLDLPAIAPAFLLEVRK